jgi:hypothetical protein
MQYCLGMEYHVKSSLLDFKIKSSSCFYQYSVAKLSFKSVLTNAYADLNRVIFQETHKE